MGIHQGIEIYSLDDIVINTALGKNVVLNGQEYIGNGIGIKWDKFKDRFTADPENIYSTKDVIIRTDKGKKVSINGTDYVSTTGIARQLSPVSSLYQQGFNWYCRDNIIINIAPGQKIIINDVEITGTPEVPSTATVGSLVPNTGQAASVPSVDVNGTGFTPSTLIYTNGSSIQTTYVSATKLTTTYFASETNVAVYPVGVKKTGELLSNTLPFNLTADVDDPSTATVGSLSPNTALVNSGLTVTVNGTGFTAATVIQANGNPVQTSYVSATQLTTTYLGTVSSAQTVAIAVKKPGELISNSVNFSVTVPAAPNIGSLSPSTLAVSSGTLVTVTGTNFVSGCVIKADGVGVQTTFVSSTSLTTTYLGTVASASTVAVTVQNPDTQTSNSVNFIVTAAPVGPPVTSGLMTHYDASDTASITHTAGVVSTWNDKSGANRHLVKTAGAGPITGTRTINSKNVIDFTSDQLKATLVQAQPVTLFAVAQSDTVSVSNGQIIANVGNCPTVWGSGSKWALYAGSVLASTTSIDTNAHTLSAVFNGAASELWLDGTSILIGSPGATGFGTQIAIGTDGSGHWDGRIAEVLTYDRVLTTLERQQVESYLATKWGTPTASVGPPVTSGLMTHYDASDAATITLGSGSFVVQWNDKSGNNRHVTANPGVQPTTGVRTLNGKNALDFAGSQRMSCTHGAVTNAPFTMFFALASDIATANNQLTSVPNILGYSNNWCLFASGIYDSGDVVNTSAHVVMGLFNDATSEIWLDGVSIGIGNPGVCSIGAGSSWNIGNSWDGPIGEFLFYNRALTVPERQQVESYLKTKWGIFSPSQLTSLAGWWDAADSATFTYGTGVQVASWVDKSPNTFTVSRTPSTLIQRTGDINSVPCVTNTSISAALSRASTDVRAFVDSSTFTDCMNFAVLVLTPTIANGAWFMASGTYRVTFDMRDPTSYFDIANAAAARLSGNIANVADTPYLFAVYRNGANVKVFRNGVELLTKSNASGNVAASQIGTFNIFNTTQGFTGKIGEIIHVARYNATDFTTTQQYLATKWGITLP